MDSAFDFLLEAVSQARLPGSSRHSTTMFWLLVVGLLTATTAGVIWFWMAA